MQAGATRKGAALMDNEKKTLPDVGQTLKFRHDAGSLRDVAASVVSKCPRHGYVIAQVTEGNRWYRFGHRLHVVARQPFEVQP